MFDEVAEKYDITNDVLSLWQDRRWRSLVVEALEICPGDKVLDLAAGTAVSTEPMLAAGAQAVAADFSLGMLTVGRRTRSQVPMVGADATCLPFADDSFDAVTMSFGLRNVVDYKQGLAELLRVTKPGGRVVICEFSHPTWGPFRHVYVEYLMKVLPEVAKVVSSDPESYVYLAESIRAWPTQAQLALSLQDVGWCDVAHRNISGGIVALHRGFKPGV